MMTRGVALMWEEWRRSRRAVILLGCVLLAFLAVLRSVEEPKELFPLGPLSLYVVGGLIMYLLLCQSTRKHVAGGVPARRFRLPVSSLELALWPFLYRLSVVSMMAMLAALICRSIDPDFPFYGILFIIWLILSAFHTLAYTTALLGTWLPVLLGGLMIYPGALWFVRAYSDPGWRYPEYDLAGMAAAGTAALVLTAAGIGKTRRGGFSHGFRKVVSVRLAAAPGAGVFEPKAPFFSAAAAQRWFERRCTGKTAVLLTGMFTLAFLVSESNSQVLYSSPGSHINLELGLVIFLVNCAMAGLWAFAGQAERARRSYTMFVHTRPVSDFGLARGKFEVAMMFILFNLALVGVVLLASTVVVGVAINKQDWGEVLGTDWEWRHLLLVPLSVGLGWIAYWRGAVVAGFLIGFAIYSEAAPGHFERWVYSDGGFTGVALGCMGAGMLVLGGLFLRAYRRKVLTVTGLAGIGAAWAAVTAVSALLFVRYGFPGFQTSGAWFASGLPALLALTPFAIVPARIARARHG